MLKVFLGFSFDDATRPLAAAVEGLLESHEAQVITGEDLGGGSVTQAVEARIEQAHALVALLTPDERKANGRYACKPWVHDELIIARTRQKLAIAVLDDRVEPGGAYKEHELIPFLAEAPLPAFLKLSRTIGQWKRQIGRLVRVRILPDTLAQKVADSADSNGGEPCESRLVAVDGVSGPWQAAPVVHEIGGTFAYVRGAQDDTRVQLRITLGNEVWQSPAANQWMDLKLEKRLR